MPMSKQDEIQIEVLADGTIKVTTDNISPANHMSADKLVDFIAQMAGGQTTRQSRGHSHVHTHEHKHVHSKG